MSLTILSQRETTADDDDSDDEDDEDEEEIMVECLADFGAVDGEHLSTDDLT